MRNAGVQGGELLFRTLRCQSLLGPSFGRRFLSRRARLPEKRTPRTHGLRRIEQIEGKASRSPKSDGRPLVNLRSSSLLKPAVFRISGLREDHAKPKPHYSRKPLANSRRSARRLSAERGRTHVSLSRRPLDNLKFISLVFELLAKYNTQLEDAGFLMSVGLQDETNEQAKKQLLEFVDELKTELKWWDSRSSAWKPPPLVNFLQQIFVASGLPGINAQLKFMFQGHNANCTFTKADIQNQAMLADLRYPTEWFPATRAIQRTIHLHVGPTNSGKTYHALKRLEQAKSGIYAGPLRLLAHEVYTRLNSKGIGCHLLTGDEKILKEGDIHMSSCTVEMAPLNTEMEVAVVDEIQMIGNRERGWAWTLAVLGLKAKELHLCGEERATSLIRELAAATGDKLQIHRYERLSPLRTMSTSLDGDLKKLRKGDCLILFSRVELHAAKKRIGEMTGKRVAIIYGSLPPDIRAQQAKLFNDPDNDYDFLVATDAIGMGLNLSIKRIIFESVLRSNGRTQEVLPISDIKQIAGRAGRYTTAVDDIKAAQSLEMSHEGDKPVSKNLVMISSGRNLGLVTSLEKDDLPVIQRAMQIEAEPILTAGILPPSHILKRFAAYFPPQTPFSYILLRLHEISWMHPRFHLCDLKSTIAIADALQPLKDLSIDDRITICSGPVNLKDPGADKILQAYARCIISQSDGDLLDIPELDLEILDRKHTASKEYLVSLEAFHKALVLYLWLSYRFKGVFISQALAFHVKSLVEEKIDKALDDFVRREQFQSQNKIRDTSILRKFLAQVDAQDSKEMTTKQDSTASTNRQPSLQNLEIPNEPLLDANQTMKLLESLS